MYFLDGKRPDAGYCNKTLLLALESAFRREQLFSITRDQYERIVYTFRDCPIYDVGTKADQINPIITDAESFGGQTNCTSDVLGQDGGEHAFPRVGKRASRRARPRRVADRARACAPASTGRPAWPRWHVRCLARVQGVQAVT